MNLFYKTNQLLQRVLLAILCLSFGVVQAQTTSSTNFNGAAGNIVVAEMLIGTSNGAFSGVSTENNGASPIRLVEYSNTGAPTGAYYQFGWRTADPTSDYLVQSYTATSNGYIDLSDDGKFLAVAGYSTTRELTPSGVTSSSVNRVIARVGGATNGTSFLTAFNTRTSATAFSGDNLRSATLLGGNFYAAGTGGSGTGGVHKFNPPSTQVCTTQNNCRVVKNFNGRLFYSSGSGASTIGINVIGTYNVTDNTYTTSVPTTITASTRLFVPNLNSTNATTDPQSVLNNSSPYDYSINSSGTVVYLTDDQTDADGGIYKYVWSGGAWSLACKFELSSTTSLKGAWGLYVDWTTTNPTIYATRITTTSAGGNALVKFTDIGGFTGAVDVSTGSNATNTGFTILATSQGSTGASATTPLSRFVGITKAPTRTDIVPTKLVIQNVNSGNSPTRFRTFGITVQAEDAAGNPGVISSSSATPITLAVVTGAGTLSTTSVSFPANAVSATFNVSLNDVGAHTISVNDGRGTPTLTGDVSDAFTVNGAATSLVFTGVPSGTTTNSPFGFTVTATKDDLSAETTYPGSCVITSTGSMPQASYTSPFVNGVATFSDIQFSSNGTFTFTANAAGLPALNATSGNVVVSGGPQTYTWVGADSALWSAPTSWSPERTIASTTDRILFDGGTAIVKVDVNAQTLATFRVINGADVKLVANSTTDKVFTIGSSPSVAGTDFEVTTGSKLRLSSKFASTGIKLNLATGNFGSVAGSIYFTSELTSATSIDNQITAVQAYSANTAGIEVLGTAYFEQGLRQSGNPFGNSASNVNSIKFRNHAIWRQIGSGSNPFGVGAPNSVVDFESNARYVIGSTSANSPAISGRTYPIFEIDADYTFSNTFSNAWTVNRLRVNAGKKFFISLASGTNPLNIDTLELGTNAEYREVLATPTRVVFTLNAINAASGSRLQLGGPATNLNFTAGSTLKSLTNVSANAMTVTTPIVIDSVVAPVGGNIVSNGNITLNSTAVRQGFVAGHTGITGQVTGNVTVRRFIRPTYFNGMAVRHLSHPFTSMVAGALANPINANQIQVWNENSNASVAGSGWTNINDINSILAAGQGFAFNVAANSTVSVTGALNNGNVVREITRNASGWNLIGNPYAQTIDWDAVTADAAFDNTKIFSGRYQWVSASANTGGWLGYNNGFPSSLRYIAPMSAALVRVKSGNPTVNLTFKNAHRSADIVNALSRTAVDTRPAIELSLDRGANTVGDITSIYFQNGATGFFNDAMDAQRIGNNTGMPTLYSVVNNANYAVKGLPNLTNELIIPLGIRFHTSGTHRLSVANLQNMEAYNVYLVNYTTGTSELLTATSEVTISGAANTLIDAYALQFVPLNVTSVGTKVSAETVAVYPNPSVDGKFNVALANVAADGVATITVINTLGQVVAKQNATITAGANQISISTSGLKAGAYSVQVRTASSTITSNVVVR